MLVKQKKILIGLLSNYLVIKRQVKKSLRSSAVLAWGNNNITQKARIRWMAKQERIPWGRSAKKIMWIFKIMWSCHSFQKQSLVKISQTDLWILQTEHYIIQWLIIYQRKSALGIWVASSPRILNRRWLSVPCSTLWDTAFAQNNYFTQRHEGAKRGENCYL